MDDIQQPTSSKISNSIPETSQAKAEHHRILRKRSKTVRELNETKHQLLIQKSRAERYKKRYPRLMNKTTCLPVKK